MLAAAQVINGIASLIETAPGMTGKVFTSRMWPLTENDLPAWRVLADSEEVTPAGIAFPMREDHSLEVLCRGFVRAVSDVDDVMHALAKDALAVLFASKSAARLSPLNCVMSLARIDRDMESEGEAAMGRITLALRVRFVTFNNDPETIH